LEVKKTGLFDLHVALGGKMVEFAGFIMPIQFTSMIAEHRQVREKVGVFDVSHMGEIEIKGPKALEFVNHLCVNDVSTLQINQAQYTAMCYPEGGIVDDLICYRRQDHYLLVVNASNTEKDYQWILENRRDGVTISNLSDSITQLAVQGKSAESILQTLTQVDLSAIQFYWFAEGQLAETDMIISRTGYTGEPGFELYFDRVFSEQVWNRVFEAGKDSGIAPIGLGARDTLRLEKKYCLYGNDIDKTTNPLEAGLGWITKLKKENFIGKEAIATIKEKGLKRKLVGFVCEGKMIPRHHYSIMKNEKNIGHVTSGCYSPILDKNIGLGYVGIQDAENGNKIIIYSGNRECSAEIVKTPFV
jgi:aminomethyltransferase